jgi:hypothetical protein
MGLTAWCGRRRNPWQAAYHDFATWPLGLECQTLDFVGAPGGLRTPPDQKAGVSGVKSPRQPPLTWATMAAMLHLCCNQRSHAGRRTPFNASRGLRQLVTAEFPQRRWQRVTRRHVHSDRPPGALGVMIREGKIAENLARSHRVRWHPKVYGPKWRTAAQRLVPVRKV